MSTVKNHINELMLIEHFMHKERRTVSALCDIEADHIYLYFFGKEIYDEFRRRSKAESLKCGSDDHAFESILALQPDGSTAYCSSVSHMAFGAGEGITDNIVRIDYGKYIEGELDFFYRKQR